MKGDEIETIVNVLLQLASGQGLKYNDSEKHWIDHKDDPEFLIMLNNRRNVVFAHRVGFRTFMEFMEFDFNDLFCGKLKQFMALYGVDLWKGWSFQYPIHKLKDYQSYLKQRIHQRQLNSLPRLTSTLSL